MWTQLYFPNGLRTDLSNIPGLPAELTPDRSKAAAAFGATAAYDALFTPGSWTWTGPGPD